MFKPYRIEPCKDKFIIKLKTGFLNWQSLRWRRNKYHSEGEYCLFDTFEDARDFAEDWIKERPVRKWFEYELP